MVRFRPQNRQTGRSIKTAHCAKPTGADLMKAFARIIIIVGVISALASAAMMCHKVFETRMTRYYKVY